MDGWNVIIALAVAAMGREKVRCVEMEERRAEIFPKEWNAFNKGRNQSINAWREWQTDAEGDEGAEGVCGGDGCVWKGRRQHLTVFPLSSLAPDKADGDW